MYTDGIKREILAEVEPFRIDKGCGKLECYDSWIANQRRKRSLAEYGRPAERLPGQMPCMQFIERCATGCRHKDRCEAYIKE